MGSDEGPTEAERQAADELSRLGQEMRLDEPVTKWNLPGIQKSTISIGGKPLGPKPGYRFIVDPGNGKMTDRIIETVTHEGFSGWSMTTRPVTPEDGPRSRECRKMVRAMRRSRRRRIVRAWVGRVLGRGGDE